MKDLVSLISSLPQAQEFFMYLLELVSHYNKEDVLLRGMHIPVK